MAQDISPRENNQPAATTQAKPLKMDEIIHMYAGEEIELERAIGEGSFGMVYRCVDLKSGLRYALKAFGGKKGQPAPSASKNKRTEVDFLCSLQGKPGIPKFGRVFQFGENHWGFTMELLGPSLADIITRTGPISCRSACRLGVQLMKSLESIHDAGIIHCDLKPANILIGDVHGLENAYVVDFGVSRQYLKAAEQDAQTHRTENHTEYEHIVSKHRKGLLGTARYASINSHLESELSRRDDLESLIYVLLWALKGKLPWEHLDFRISAQVKPSAFQKILEQKRATPIEYITEGLPELFTILLRYSRGLNFKERPAYGMIVRLLEKGIEEEPIIPYEWESIDRKASPLFRNVDLLQSDYQERSENTWIHTSSISPLLSTMRPENANPLERSSRFTPGVPPLAIPKLNLKVVPAQNSARLESGSLSNRLKYIRLKKEHEQSEISRSSSRTSFCVSARSSRLVPKLTLNSSPGIGMMLSKRLILPARPQLKGLQNIEIKQTKPAKSISLFDRIKESIGGTASKTTEPETQKTKEEGYLLGRSVGGPVTPASICQTSLARKHPLRLVGLRIGPSPIISNMPR